VGASDGTRKGEPNGNMARNPEERRTTPEGGLDNKERPVSVVGHKHRLSTLVGGPEGASCSDPYGTALWNPEGKRKTRPGEASLLDQQTKDKPYNRMELLGQDQGARPGPHKAVKYRQGGLTKPQEGEEQGSASTKAEEGPVSGLRQAEGGAMQKFLTSSAGLSPKGV
jgi:hypothetical protein